MFGSTPHRSALALTLLLLASLASLPVAAASGPETDAPALPCPTLPLWDAGFCWLGVTLDIVNREYDYVTCDVIGGPVCGFNVCDSTGICKEADDQ